MNLLKALSDSLSTLDRPTTPSTREVAKVEDVRPAPAEPIADRRMQPDRRQRQVPFQGPDRRKQKSRRRPRLLHARTRQPTELEDRRGRNISTSA